MRLRGYVVVGAVVALVVLVYLYRYAMDSPFRIDSVVAKEMLASNQFDVVLDVRTDLERSTLGFYPGSIHVPSAKLESAIERVIPDKTTRILVYCNTGQRARNATEKMRTLGYTNAVYIASGHRSLM